MSYTKEQFLAVLKLAHNPALKAESMVTQIWEDGEITCQKGGDLFGQRTLHCHQSGLYNFRLPPEMMPEQRGEHGYAFVTDEDADIIRDMMQNTPDLPKFVPSPKPKDEGPLQITAYYCYGGETGEWQARIVAAYLVKEFPMCRDGKVEAHLGVDYKNAPQWEVRFPTGHDHWKGYTNTLEKVRQAAGDYLKGYQHGIDVGIVAEAQNQWNRLTKREQNRIARDGKTTQPKEE